MTISKFSITNQYRQLCTIVLAIFLVSCNNDDDNTGGPNYSGIKNTRPEQLEIAEEDKLPLMKINTGSETIVDEPKVNAQFSIIEKGVETYNGAIGIEFRGSSSQQFPKKSFGLETRDENNDDLDASLLGYPEEEDWILYAPYSDKSLLRNVLIYDLSQEIGRYTSRTTLVELEINERYQGVYVFMEKLKRDNGRIDINKLKDDENSGKDLTGGYILKIDKITGSNTGSGYNNLNSFASRHAPLNAAKDQQIYFLYEEPDAEDITTEQKKYISEYVTNFEEALASDNFSDKEIGYRSFIDTGSFIDFFLLNELANNVDGYRISTYMHKDKNKKLNMGPIWDFNLGFGNAYYCGGGKTDVWAYKFNERCPNDALLVPFWWQRFLEDPAFVAELKQRWTDLRNNTFSNATIISKVDNYIAQLNTAGAIEPSFQAWPVLGTYVWPNNFVGATYSDETNYFKKWIIDRVAWMDDAIEAL